MILKIGSLDCDNLVSGIQVEWETIVSDSSGRNAAGTMAIDVIAHKWKVKAKFIPMSGTDFSALYTAISNYSNLSVEFMNPFTNTTESITAYIGTPNVEWYRYSDNMKLTKAFTLDIIEQ